MFRESQSSVIRYPLGGRLAFGALNALAGGYYGLSGAEGVPTEWLEGSPFSDSTVPSLILFVVVGGSFMFAATAVFAGSRNARASALTAGTGVLVWIVVQVIIIGYVSWMQPATRSTRVLTPTGVRVAGDGTRAPRIQSARSDAVRVDVDRSARAIQFDP